jgi:hypothetical protein
MHFFGLMVGISLAFFLGTLYMLIFPTGNPNDLKHNWLWVLLLGLPLIFNVTRMINLFFFFRKDTPLFYMSCNQEEMARECLMEIYQLDYVDTIIREIEI